MRKDQKHKNKELDEESLKKKYFEIRPIPLYSILFCGIIITVIGLYLFFTNAMSSGFAVRAKTGNITGGGSISGPSAIFLGLTTCIFPIYQLIKQRKKEINIAPLGLSPLFFFSAIEFFTQSRQVT